VPQQVRLTAIEKVGVRGVFGIAGVTAKPGEEEAKASEFLDVMANKVGLSGGDAPLPPPLAAPLLSELRGLTGPEQLKAILQAKDALQELWNDANTLVDRKDKRLPQWDHLVALLRQAEALPIHQEIAPQVEAIRANRSLLDPTTDYVPPLLHQLEQALSAALEKAERQLAAMRAAEQEQLEASAEWQTLTPDQRNTIALAAQLPAGPIESAPLERNQLLGALQQRSLASRAELADSLPARFAKARTAAAQALEPATQPVKISSGVLKDEAALDAWWAAKRAELITKLPQGPIQIN
jgi:hypothetical protein